MFLAQSSYIYINNFNTVKNYITWPICLLQPGAHIDVSFVKINSINMYLI